MISMNVKNSRSMNKALKTTLAAALLFWSAGLFAQTFDIVERRDFWNAGRNVNGLRTDSVTVSYAELYGNYTSGKYRDANEPESQWSAGAVAGTITHLKKFSMIGGFSFENQESRNACGSMSARPGYYPVDIYEFTPGRKTRQTYAFLGGISVDVGENWRLGGKMEFTAENYTKRKDLRHTNYLLDMTVSPSIMWHRGNVAVGASYILSKNSETINVEELGITSGVYHAFIDKGLMYGVQDIWDNSSLHIKETGVSGFPSRKMSNGGAVQMQWRNLYADVEALASHGSTGEKQKIWYDFGGWSLKARLDYRIPGRSVDQYLRGIWSIDTEDNDENVLEDVTENGVTTTRKYGSNKILTRQNTETGLLWEALYPDGASVNVGMTWNREKSIGTMMYPYVMTGKLDILSVNAGFLIKFGRVDWRVDAVFSKGWDDDRMRKSDESISVSGQPFRLSEYEEWMTEWQTKPKFMSDIALRYNFRKGVYLEAAVNIITGFSKNVSGHFGEERMTETLKVGYNF